MLGISNVGWFLIILYLVAFLGMVVYFFADPDSGILGQIMNFCSDNVPSFLSKALHTLIGDYAASKVESCLGSTGNYLCYQRNPLLQSFYLCVVLGAYGMVIVNGYPMLPCYYLQTWHRYTGFAAVSFCIYLWWLACTVSPGIITKENLHIYAHNYEYHKYLYPAGRVCKTDGIIKPPRSKYCKYMKANIARFDHFCPWINQTVGMENYRYFIAFLGAHCLLLTYGAVAMAALLASEAVEKNLMAAQFYSASKGGAVPATYSIVIQYLIFENWGIFAVLLLCSVMAVVLGGFTLYHLYLVVRNTTTNESYKWSDLRGAYKKYTKQRRERIMAIELRREMRAKELEKRGNKASVDEDEVKYDEEQDVIEPLEEFPRNIYDHGIFQNLYELVYPFSLRQPYVDVRKLKKTGDFDQGEAKVAGDSDNSDTTDDETEIRKEQSKKTKKAKKRNNLNKANLDDDTQETVKLPNSSTSNKSKKNKKSGNKNGKKKN